MPVVFDTYPQVCYGFMYMGVRTKLLAAGALGALAAALLLDRTSYTVVRILDGDTFETKEKQYIRLNGIDAPEKGMCGYEQSMDTLRKLILGKRVFLKTVYFDSYNRLISNVYLKDGTFLNREMVRLGAAVVYQRGENDPTLNAAAVEARNAGRGIHGRTCSPVANTEHPECVIKGNVGFRLRKTYHLPGCNQYDLVKLHLWEGDGWFCTEKEAVSAGFAKADTCPRDTVTPSPEPHGR